MTILISIISFIVALGVLVTIHEFGHFWVARRCGVKVLRFSVGFGKPLYTFYRKDDPTEYVVAGIPLGGYVKMLDEKEGVVEEHEKEFAFNNKPLLSKVAIVLAGPVFNLLFAFFAFWTILTVGEEGLKPTIGGLNKSGIVSQSGMAIGDEIVAVNGRPAPIWRVAVGLISSELLDSGKANIRVLKSDGNTANITLNVEPNAIPEPNEIVELLGMKPSLPAIKPIIGDVIAGEPADQAGLKPGDVIALVNNAEVLNWHDWVQLTRSNPNKPLQVEVLRDGEYTQLLVTPKEIIENNEPIGRIGVMPYIDESVMKNFYAIYRLDLMPAFVEAGQQTVGYSVLTVKLIGRMLIGEASVQNLSGPISIAQYAGQTASIGFVSFLKFLAFVSISLGVINLLPIPMLDGGHLMFYLIEAIKGEPLSDAKQAIFMRFGVVLLLAMMLLAIFIDVGRLIN
jgi:regulator of sigma E protease